MSALMVDVFVVAVLAGALIAAATGGARGLAYMRLHRPIANRRFMAQYRAQHRPQRSGERTDTGTYGLKGPA